MQNFTFFNISLTHTILQLIYINKLVISFKVKKCAEKTGIHSK